MPSASNTHAFCFRCLSRKRLRPSHAACAGTQWSLHSGASSSVPSVSSLSVTRRVSLALARTPVQWEELPLEKEALFHAAALGRALRSVPHEDPGSKEQRRLAVGREDALPLGIELEAQFLHLSSRGRVRSVWDAVVKSAVVAAHCTCPLPGPPWAALASSENGPVIFLLSSVTQGKVEMKLGVSKTELCGCFKMCLLRILQAHCLCNIWIFLFHFFFICLRGRGMVARSSGDFPPPRFVSQQSSMGPAVFRGPAKFSRACGQLGGGRGGAEEPSLSSYGGTPGGPQVLLCFRSNGASLTPVSPSQELEGVWPAAQC